MVDAVLLVKRNVSHKKRGFMDLVKVDKLAERILQKRAGKGIRATAVDVGVSPATLSRVENGKIPDLETFGKICGWLGDDPAIYLGLQNKAIASPKFRVHFKKGATMEKDSAVALGEMILLAQRAVLEEAF